MASRKELAKGLTTLARENKKKFNAKPPLEVDEKGVYYQMLYDKKQGYIFDEHKTNKFKELDKKYGKTSN